MAASRIMVAVSSPWASEKLFATVHDLADRLAGSVVVTHVVRATEEDDSTDQARQRGEQTLAGLADRLQEAKVQAEGVLLFGDDVARAILNAARAHNITLIVLGLSGKGRVARLLEGDVPQQVMRQADVPVLMFPPDWSGAI